MACEIKLNGVTVDKAFLTNLLNQAGNDVNVRNAIILDNYLRLTKDEAEVSKDALDYLKTTFGLDDAGLEKALQAEHARREATGKTDLREKARASVVLNNTKESLKKAKLFARRLFSNKGVWKVFDVPFRGKLKNSQILRDGTINMWITKAHRLTSALQETLDSADKYLTQEDKIGILNVLNGDKWESVPFVKLVGDPKKKEALIKKLAPIVQEMRAHIDEGTQKIVNFPGLVTQLQALTFLDNQNKYTTILYEAHRNPNWAQMFLKQGDKFVGGDFAEAIFNAATPDVIAYLEYEKEALERLTKRKLKSRATLSTKLATQTDPRDRAATESMIAKIDKEVSNMDNRLKVLDKALTDKEALQIEVFNTLNDMYKDQNITNFATSGGYRGAMGKAIFKKRQNIPESIRKLYGKIEDPGLVYQASISKMISIVANAEYQKNMFDINNDMLKNYNEAKARGEKNLMPPIFSTKPLKDAGLIYKINLTDSFSILADNIGSNEVYVNEQMKEFFSENNFGESVNGFMQLVTFMNTTAKINATVLNLPTQERNFFANMGKIFSVAVVELFSRRKATVLKQLGNSISQRVANEAKNAARLLKIRKGVVRYSNDYERLEFIMTQQGLKNSDIVVGALSEEIKNLEGWGDVLNALASKSNITKAIYNIINPAIKNTAGLAKRMYAASDDIAKEALFMGELENYSQALYGKSYKELLADGNPDQITSVENIAGAIVRDVMPNYNNAWELTKALQKSGASLVLSPFGIFRMEQIRTTIETFRIAKAEITNKNPDPEKRARIKRIGYERFAGFSALVSFSSYLAIKALGGADAEDEEFIREYWFEDMETPLVYRDSDSNYRVMDMSTVNLYGSLGLVDRYLMFELMSENKEVSENAVWNLISKIASPIFAPQIGVASLAGVIQGKDKWGKDLFQDEDDVYTKFVKGFLELAENVYKPGFIKGFERMDDNEKEIAIRDELVQTMRANKVPEEFISYAEADLDNLKKSSELYASGYKTGINPRIVNPDVMAPPLLYKFGKIKDSYASKYRDLANKLKKGEVDIEKESIYIDLQDDYFDQLDKVREYYEKALSVGFNPINIITYGPIRKGLTDASSQNSAFSKKEIEYITGKTNTKPNLKIVLEEYITANKLL